MLRGSRFRMSDSEVPQNSENRIFCRSKSGFDSGAAKLQGGVTLIKMPRDTSAQRDCAFKPFVEIGYLVERGFSGMGIEHQQDPAIIFTREFTDHQRAGSGGSFPMHVAGAIGWHVFAERVKNLAPTPTVAFHAAFHAPENF